MVLGLLALTDIASVLVHLEYTKLWPTKTAAGIVLSSDYSSFKLILFDWLFGFFDFMGRGFFVPLFCLGPWPLPGAGPATLGGLQSAATSPAPAGAGSRPSGAAGGEAGSGFSLGTVYSPHRSKVSEFRVRHDQISQLSTGRRSTSLRPSGI